MAYLMLQNLKTFLKYFFKIYELKINHSPLLSSHSSPPTPQGGAPAPLLTVLLRCSVYQEENSCF